MSGPFRRSKGGVTLRLSAEEVAFLKDLPVVLTQLGLDPDHPATRRLSVPIYLDDPDSQQEYARWMGPEIEQARLADRSAFDLALDAAVAGTTLSLLEAEAFLRVLAEGRLALGAGLRIDVEADYERLEEGEAAALDYLAFLQGALIETLSRLSFK